APWLKDLQGLQEDVPNPDLKYEGSNPVLVAVVDSGLNTAHPFISAALSQNSREQNSHPGDHDGNGYRNDVVGANVFTRDGNVSEEGSDHGTHVAGLVKVIRDQAIPSFDEARAVQILPIKFIDSSGYGSTAGA